jgi:hypothetical protein
MPTAYRDLRVAVQFSLRSKQSPFEIVRPDSTPIWSGASAHPLPVGTGIGRCLIPRRFIVELDLVTVRILAHESRTVRQIAVGPADIKSGSFKSGHAPFERLRRR